jgi:hypothetical protein
LAGAIVIPELDSKEADDRVRPLTRGVAAVIVPFLVVEFAVLYPWPGDTDRLFAWHIRPMITAMVLGSANLGGAYLFVCTVRARSCITVKAGFVPVAVFAIVDGNCDHLALEQVSSWPCRVLAVGASVFHDDLPDRRGVAAHRRHDVPPDADELLLSIPAARVIAAVGVLLLVWGLFLFLL